MCNCDELSLSGLDMVSPFNDMPESIGPSIDCGREFEPSICNQAWNLKWVNIEALISQQFYYFLEKNYLLYKERFVLLS